jgi:hypothetical protein
MFDNNTDRNHRMILGAITMLGILLGHALASALFHFPGL